MKKRDCVLEYLAKEIEKGISSDTIEQDREAIQVKCLYCSSSSRCNYYIPLIRIQHIRHGERLYGKKYLKKQGILQVIYETKIIEKEVYKNE